MTEVKKPRPYDSSLRRRQAAETRLRILHSAESLFAARGYAATTMDAIAHEAGVAVDTVYASFGAKAGVLHRLLDVRVGGDEAPVSLLERPGPRAVLAEPDSRAMLAAFASSITEILERSSAVAGILRGAAAVDGEIAELLAQMEGTRFANLRTVAVTLAERGDLRSDLDVERAAASIWALASPQVHGMLRRDRGWSQEEYSGWLAASLARILLASGSI